MFNSELEILEYLARLEHEQWMHWSKAIADKVDDDTRTRWSACWMPYEDLTEEQKQKDREWAMKVITILNIVREDDLNRFIEMIKHSLENRNRNGN